MLNLDQKDEIDFNRLSNKQFDQVLTKKCRRLLMSVSPFALTIAKDLAERYGINEQDKRLQRWLAEQTKKYCYLLATARCKSRRDIDGNRTGVLPTVSHMREAIKRLHHHGYVIDWSVKPAVCVEISDATDQMKTWYADLDNISSPLILRQQRIEDVANRRAIKEARRARNILKNQQQLIDKQARKAAKYAAHIKRIEQAKLLKVQKKAKTAKQAAKKVKKQLPIIVPVNVPNIKPVAKLSLKHIRNKYSPSVKVETVVRKKLIAKPIIETTIEIV